MNRKIWQALNIQPNRQLPIKIGIYFAGTAINCLGTALLTLNALGSDAMNTLFVAIAAKLGVLSGDVYTVFNAAMLLAGFLFASRYMGGTPTPPPMQTGASPD